MMDLDPKQYQQVNLCDDDVRNIVWSYLVHNCYKETANAFLSTAGIKNSSEPMLDMDTRKLILQHVQEGKVLDAIEMTEQLAPKLLESNMDLHFDLLTLHFIDLIRTRKCGEALEFGQKKLIGFGKVQKYIEKMEDVMALMAYEDPEKSPMFHLLSLEYRQSVADGLNQAILEHSNMPAHSELERLAQQATVVRQYLHEFDKDSHPPFSLKAFVNE
ncbi:lisH and RanBPM domains containing protein [Carex rostrata]